MKSARIFRSINEIQDIQYGQRNHYKITGRNLTRCHQNTTNDKDNRNDNKASKPGETLNNRIRKKDILDCLNAQ